jgi:hypothetical protein
MLCRKVSEEEEASLKKCLKRRMPACGIGILRPAGGIGRLGWIIPRAVGLDKILGEIGEDVVFVTEQVKKRYD